MALLPVGDALDRLLDPVSPLPSEQVLLQQAAGRYAAADIVAKRTQPPFPASAMDGYAVRLADIVETGTVLRIIGQAAAGHPFPGTVNAEEAVRIFTGAPVPNGADTVVIQENTEADPAAGIVTITDISVTRRYIRAAGLDFSENDILVTQGRRLDAAALSLCAAANHAQLPVHRRPRVAILATGDELLPPGTEPGHGQIIASNSYGVAAIASDCGAEVCDLGIAVDTTESLRDRLAAAQTAGADVLVTLGGASVGDHDLVQSVFAEAGMGLDFWRIAMRPGKPLMAGRLGAMTVLGLPGNPVSSLVCAHLFLAPLLATLQGGEHMHDMITARLAAELKANDERQDYLRARWQREADGSHRVEALPVQDSSMLKVLADANGLIIRPPHAPPAPAGMDVEVLVLRR